MKRPPVYPERPTRTRMWIIPAGATLLASATAAMPLVTSIAALPPLGLMMALAWRLRRPEMWPAWVALPLGLADDLLGGAPLGSAMTLWTISFLAIDAADARPMWRDHWLDWAIAGAAILFCALGGWGIAAFTGGGGRLLPLLVPAVLGIVMFPAMARLCALLDGWRLAR